MAEAFHVEGGVRQPNPLNPAQKNPLQRVADLDPDPGNLNAALASLIDELGPPSGPIRALAMGFRDDWQGLASNPQWLQQLRDEAVQQRERGNGGGRQLHS